MTEAGESCLNENGGIERILATSIGSTHKSPHFSAAPLSWKAHRVFPTVGVPKVKSPSQHTDVEYHTSFSIARSKGRGLSI